MRVKVGQTWYEVSAKTPILIEMTDSDRKNIAAMDPTCTMYAVFAEDDPLTTEQRLQWMEDGRVPWAGRN